MSLRDTPIASPCVRVCELGDDGVCRGCYRSTDEIMAWPTASNDQRRQFVLNAEARLFSSNEKGH